MREVQFVKSAVYPNQYPNHREPEVALAGRSNVGKSSLINALAGRKGIAKVSGRPGKTQTINFYKTDERVWLVDLPGYGYAAVPGKVRESFAPMIETYLTGRDNLVGILLLLDARHAPTPLDLQMKEWILPTGLPTICVATKWDKLKASEQARRRKEMEEKMGWHVIPFSAVKPIGRNEIRAIIRGWAKDAGRRD